MAHRAPPGVRAFAWVICAVFIIPLYAVSLVLGRWLRRREGGALPAEAPPSSVAYRSRLILYVIAVVVTIVSAERQSKVVAARHLLNLSSAEVFVVNILLLAVLIVGVEISVRRRRGPPGQEG
ncbi:MAG: hypothetical protein ABSG13_30560 [Bryobacteraceae bacterium]